MLINDTAGRRSCESMDGFIVHGESELQRWVDESLNYWAKRVWVVLPRLLFVLGGFRLSMWANTVSVTCWRDFSISNRSEFGNLGQMYENTCLKVFNFLQAKLLFSNHSHTVVVLFSKNIGENNSRCQSRYCLFVWNMRFPDSIQMHIHLPYLGFDSFVFPMTIDFMWRMFLQKTLKNLSSSEVTYILDLDHITQCFKDCRFFGALV